MSNLLFFSFAKSSASTPIYSYSPDKLNEDALKIEVSKVLTQLKQISLRANERQKINTGNGSWYCKKDDKDITYLILSNQNYPERLIYQAIDQLNEHLKKLGKSYNTEPDSSLKSHSKTIMQEILTKYENPKKMDKVAEVNSNIEQVRSSVRSSVRKILTNQADLEGLELKAASLKDHAMQFSKSANELERLMYWRNCKLKVLVAIVVVSLLCYILVPIIQKAVAK